MNFEIDSQEIQHKMNFKKVIAVFSVDLFLTSSFLGIAVQLNKELDNPVFILIAIFLSYLLLLAICVFFRIIPKSKNNSSVIISGFIFSALILAMAYIALLTIFGTSTKNMEALAAFIFSRVFFVCFLAGIVGSLIKKIRDNPNDD